MKRLRKTEELIYVSQITPAYLDQWRLCWAKDAYRVEDQIKNTKAGRLLEKLKSFMRYCLQMGWIQRDPAAFMEPIKPDDTNTLPAARRALRGGHCGHVSV